MHDMGEQCDDGNDVTSDSCIGESSMMSYLSAVYYCFSYSCIKQCCGPINHNHNEIKWHFKNYHPSQPCLNQILWKHLQMYWLRGLRISEGVISEGSICRLCPCSPSTLSPLSTECQNATCGDGFIRVNYEQCDGPNVGRHSCESILGNRWGPDRLIWQFDNLLHLTTAIWLCCLTPNEVFLQSERWMGGSMVEPNGTVLFIWVWPCVLILSIRVTN